MTDVRNFPELEELDENTHETTVKTCGHASCACLMQEEEVYCSDECEHATHGGSCPCGHLACTSETEHEA